MCCYHSVRFFQIDITPVRFLNIGDDERRDSQKFTPGTAVCGIGEGVEIMMLSR